jgi:hypothetical protein
VHRRRAGFEALDTGAGMGKVMAGLLIRGEI